MPLNFQPLEPSELTPRIVVFGVGGAGGNAINNMIDQQLEGVEFVAANTDAQALLQSQAEKRLQLGASVTKGLGAGARPEIGGEAAEESIDDVRALLDGVNMCFITAGMGGGTGTGAAPVIARTARELGVLTVGVVTKPFAFEGQRRMVQAEKGIEALTEHVDTLIVIPNQNLFRVANERTTFAQAFLLADDVLYQGVKGVTDLMVRPGLVNLDFADVRAVMDEMGKAMMGSGEADGERRAIEAAERAIDNPLLDEVSLRGAKGVLINITGGLDMKLFEVDEAASRIRKEADPDAAVFFGSALDPEMEGKIRVSVVATGIDAESMRKAPPTVETTEGDVDEAPVSVSSDEASEEPVEVFDAVAIEDAASEAPEVEMPADPDPIEPDPAEEPVAASSAPNEQLVRKLTGAEASVHGGDKKPSIGDIDAMRVEIPSFLRRHAS